MTSPALTVFSFGELKLIDEDAAAGAAAAAAKLGVVPGAIAPKETAALVTGFLSSDGPPLLLLVFVVGVVVETTDDDASAGLPNENPAADFADSSGLAADAPKLKPPLVVVVEVTASDFCPSSGAGFAPNEKPPAPNLTADLGSSFFSIPPLPLSATSVAAAAGLPTPKENPKDGELAVAPWLPPVLIPKVKPGFSPEVVLVVEATLVAPKVNPTGVGEAAAVLAGTTPSVNPIGLGVSLHSSDFWGTPKLNVAAVVVVLLPLLLLLLEDFCPNENDGASAGVEPGFA